MDGVNLYPLKKIKHPKGDIYHALRYSDPGFNGFGEAYFSSVKYGEIKGWKKHSEMHLSIVVPVGEIEFVIHDNRKDSQTRGDFYRVKLSSHNYKRLNVSPDLWVAFRGKGEGVNMLLNIASIEHDPNESANMTLNEIVYEW
jgi:dTDP-4-dehydrorhamnose 3,5-epimerase